MTATKMSNATAREFFLHDNDTYHTTDEKCCFFSEGGYENGWGFWVRPDGMVDVDNESSNGQLPSRKIVDACVRAAVKHLKK